MDLLERKRITEKQETSRDQRHKKISGAQKGEPRKGDTCRVRIVGEKRPMNYKAHLGVDNDGLRTTWSDLRIVQAVRRSTVYGTVKCKVEGDWFFWPGEIQVVPVDTVALQDAPTWGKDGNADFAQKQGPRRSKRLAKGRTTNV
jgi:hypothetical protein